MLSCEVGPGVIETPHAAANLVGSFAVGGQPDGPMTADAQVPAGRRRR